MRHLVRTPHGICVVTLKRTDLDIGERGGFVAAWAAETGGEEVLELGAYHQVVKAYLAELHKKRHSREAGTITLNLASHQLIDDLEGWTKLNWSLKE